MSKSWGVTLTAFILAILAPVLDGPAADYGIDISEKDVEHFLYLMFGIGATGVAAKGGKKLIEKKTIPNPIPAQVPEPKAVIPPSPDVKPAVDDPKPAAAEPAEPKAAAPPARPAKTEMNTHGWYSTNLEYKKHTGAVIYKANPFLIIKVPRAEIVTATLKQGDNIIDSKQGTDSITFYLLERKDGKNVARMGELEFNFRAWIDNRWNGADGRFTVL